MKGGFLMHGYFGELLDVNLSKEQIGEFAIPEAWIKKHLGGRGLGTRFLLDKLKVGVDPLGPENILVLITGPLQGTNFPGAGKHAVMAKSPKTKAINESYAGGFFAHELATSGYDGIIIKGKAEDPKYFTLIEGEPKIRDADKLWGLKTAEVEEKLKKKHGQVRVASIGPAGEKLIMQSCIINDRNRAAGRPGFGAVMGSKKLKAIVVKGGLTKTFSDDDKFKKVRKQFAKQLTEDPSMQSLGKYGTASGVKPLNELGILPTKNFQEGEFEGAEAISGETMYQEIIKERDSCTGCPVRCKRVVGTEFAGEKVEKRYGGPEYETIGAFGSLCLNDNLASIALANQKCNAYGLDTISIGNIAAFVMEATEKGIIDEAEGIGWGDSEGILRLIDQIVKREGIGDLLSKGLKYAADELDVDFAVHVKGQEVPLHEPRGKKGLAISYATSPRGATHLEAMHDEMFEGVETPTPELGVTEPIDRFSWNQKAKLCEIYEDLYSFVNSSIICGFVSWNRAMDEKYYPFPAIRQAINSITGFDIDTKEMMKIGERNYVIRRILTAREGFTRNDDDLPSRLKQTLRKGASGGEDIPDETLQKCITEYYNLRGFDKYGPTNKKLRELGLEELISMIPREE